MHRLLAALLILGDAQLATPQASSVRSWAGEYEYGEFAPPDQSMTYVIKIMANGNAEVAVDGHLTTIHLIATARTESGHALGIFYERRGDYELPELGLKRGDRVVTLRKKGVKYLMRWGGLTDQFDQPQAEVEIQRRK
jgi:hypothetical protein